MSKSIAALVSALFLTLFSSTAFSQTLQVATGSPTGTYSNMFQTATKMCPIGLQVTEVNTTGSVENVDGLIGNTINAGFAQADVLAYRARSEDLDGLKALLIMHDEEVHFIALSAERKEGGFLGFGAKRFTLSDVADLQGRNVGAVGGSVISANLISALSGLKFNVLPFGSNEQALEAVRKGEIDAMVAVGGVPLQVVTKLTPEFRLLTVPREITENERLMSVYKPTRVTYNNMNARGVQTIAVPAVLVTRDYKTPRYVEALLDFRECILSRLDEIRETTGTHAKWQQVGRLSGEKPVWPIYQPGR